MATAAHEPIAVRVRRAIAAEPTLGQELAMLAVPAVVLLLAAIL